MINQLVQAAIDHHSDPRYLREVITQIVKKTEPVDHIKLLGEIYGFLQSTCPEGMADEAFRVVPEPLRAQAIAPYAKPCDQSGERVRHTPEAGRIEVAPHAVIRAEYAKQVKDGNMLTPTQIAKWRKEFVDFGWSAYLRVKTEQATEIAELKAQRKSLTDEQLRNLHHIEEFGLFCSYEEFEQIARAIEQLLKD